MTEKIIKDGSGQTLRSYEVDGYNVPAFYLSPEKIRDIVLSLPNMFCRKDDLMLCTYPKTGTNWVYEIMMMLIQGSSQRVNSNKVQTMLEIQPAEMIDDLPSPRILNTHLSPRVENIMGEGDFGVEYGKYTTYLREWEEIIDSGVKFPLHVIYYEDLHKDCIKEVRRLAQFLEVQVSDGLIQEIVDMCSFDKMGQEKFHPAVKKLLFNQHFQFFRKGKVGDWKNWFTPEQNKECDA